jgi:hypothetical protein
MLPPLSGQVQHATTTRAARRNRLAVQPATTAVRAQLIMRELSQL